MLVIADKNRYFCRLEICIAKPHSNLTNLCGKRNLINLDKFTTFLVCLSYWDGGNMWSAFCHVRNIQFQIEDGEIFATINQKDGMVEFHDNPEKYNSAHMLLQLNTEVSSLQHSYYQGIFLFMFEIQYVCWVFRSDKKLSFVKIGSGF